MSKLLTISLMIVCSMWFAGIAFAQGAGSPGVITPQSLNPTNPSFPFQPFPTPGNRPVTPTPGSPVGNPGPPVSVTQPWMGINSAQPMVGQVLRQSWVEPQILPIVVYVRQPEGIPEEWQTQYVEVPGYWVTETTKGIAYPARWVIENPGYGVYQWRLLPAYFQAR